MENTIKGDLIAKFAPEKVSVSTWLNGKPTRNEIMEYMSVILERLSLIQDSMATGLDKINEKISHAVDEQIESSPAYQALQEQNRQLYSNIRIANLQVSTLIRIASEDTAGGMPAARKKFADAVLKELDLANFIDSLTHTKGLNYDKSMEEKIKLLFDWNSNPARVKCDFDPIDIKTYILNNLDTLDSLYVRDLIREFNIELELPTPSIITL